MAKVVLLNDPALRNICEPVKESEDIGSLIEEMYQTMLAEYGAGLAANQIGVCKRLFITREPEGYSVYINPEVLSYSDEVITFDGEGCLSIPGPTAKTKRHKTVLLKWEDQFGKINEMQFEGIKAIVIQHEMDHLNGKLYIDQLGPVYKNLILTKHKKWISNKNK